jgi:hypothetical protein
MGAGGCMAAEESGAQTWEANEQLLTIFFSEQQVQVPMVLKAERLGDRSREDTGLVDIDGRNLSERTVLIFAGELHRYDAAPGAPPERHLMLVQPHYIDRSEGAANAEGFLRADLKASERQRNLSSHEPLGKNAGLFKGQIIATEAVTLDGSLAPSLDKYLLRSSNAFRPPPNRIANAEIRFLPHAALVKLAPSGGCYGDSLVDVTIAHTPLEAEIELQGFRAGKRVTVETRFLVPRFAGAGPIEHFKDWVGSFLWSDSLEEHLVTQTVSAQPGARIKLPAFRPPEAAWGADHFEMAVEVRAYVDKVAGPFAKPYIHRLVVTDPGAHVAVDAFALCPIGDAACQELRDKDAPDNVIARRRVLEWKAETMGLYQTVVEPIGSCVGGNVATTSYGDYCSVYHESKDKMIKANVKTALNFQINVNGKANAGGSLAGTYNGIAAGEIQAEAQASLGLEVDLGASFATSSIWLEHASLTTIYDPSTTQLQWWRVVAPRLHYVEVAEFSACGDRVASAEVFLADLRDSRLMLACEAVPSFNTVCHAVEPTADAVKACKKLLIDPKSARGKQCLSHCGSACSDIAK